MSNAVMPLLYCITDNELTPNATIFEMVKQALIGGAKMIQLRDKKNSSEQKKEIAKKLKGLCDYYEADFIVNDDASLAKEVDATGVHVGSEDISSESAISMLGGKIIGASCYGDIEQALRLQDQGVTYVAFGSCFASKTKPESAVIGTEILKEAKARLQIPVCAIGGINLSNLEEVVNSGINIVAVVSDIWKAPDIAAQANEYIKIFEKLRKYQ